MPPIEHSQGCLPATEIKAAGACSQKPRQELLDQVILFCLEKELVVPRTSSKFRQRSLAPFNTQAKSSQTRIITGALGFIEKKW